MTFHLEPETSEIGSGHVARVYRTKRGTALKVQWCPNSYRSEVDALRRLRGCRHAPQMIRYGPGPGRTLCIEMELLRRAPKGGKRSMPTLRDLKTALGVIHRRGVVHHDITELNIMYRGRTVVFIDYGNSSTTPRKKGRGVRSRVPLRHPKNWEALDTMQLRGSYKQHKWRITSYLKCGGGGGEPHGRPVGGI